MNIIEFINQMMNNPMLLVSTILTLGVILVNGWTDAPNAIATCVSTRVISVRKAIIMAAIFNFGGVLIITSINSSVAFTIYKMVDFGGDSRLALIALCAAMAFMHGAQDGQKFMAIFLLGAAMANRQADASKFVVPIGLMILCTAVMGLATSIGGYRIIKSVGMGMVKLKPYQGFAADFSATICLLLSSFTGIPVSTTHTKTTAIMGVEASKLLEEILCKFNRASIDDYRRQMHKIEHRGDGIHHDILSKLSTEFITPIDQEDILHLVQIIDDITDALDEVILDIYMYHIEVISEKTVELSRIVNRCVRALDEAASELKNFKKREALHALLVKVNDIEIEADKIYTDAIYELFGSDVNEKTLLGTKAVYEGLENCCDLCEHAADVIEQVIIKNT